MRTSRPAVALALLALAQLIVSLDMTIVYVALPEIGAGLHFGAQTLQLVISAYAVAFGGLLLLGGRVCDLLGRRRMFVAGLLVYGIASLVGGLAESPALLIGARALQGAGGAIVFPATLSLVHTLFAEGADRNRALGVWAGAGAGGMVTGVLLGGLLTQAFGWTSVFFVNVPLVVLAVPLAFAVIRRDPPADSRRTFDLPGAASVTLGMTFVLYALVQGPNAGWGSAGVLGAFAAGAVMLAAFAAIERRSQAPLLPMRLLAIPNVRLGALITLLFMATFGTLLYFLTLYFQQVRGDSALLTGVNCLIPMAGVFAGSNAGGRIMTRLGLRRTLLVSLVVALAGFGALAAALTATATLLSLVPGLVVLSVAQGVIFPAMFAVAATGVDDADQGVAAGLASSGQQCGSALGLAVLVAIANHGTAGRTGAALHVAQASGIRTAVLVAAAGVALLVPVVARVRPGGGPAGGRAEADDRPGCDRVAPAA